MNITGVRTENMTSAAGNKVANQFIITVGGYEYFQSYKTVIACRGGGKLRLDPDWDYSNTTRKYLYQFTGMNRKEIEAGIKSGAITIENLN